MTVEPSTTCEFSESPLKAATVRVVRLLAAAIEHSVSPGCTVCGTAALAGTAAMRPKMTANSGVRRKALASCVVCDTPRLALHVRYWKRVARGYVALHGILRPVEDLTLWAQKWRWYERNSLPWNRARIHYEFARRRAFVRWPVQGNVLEMLLEQRLEVGEHVLLEPNVWLTGPGEARIRIGGGSFLNLGVMVAAVELV